MKKLLIGLAVVAGLACLFAPQADATTVTEQYETVGLGACVGHSTIAGTNSVTIPSGRYEVSATVEASYLVGTTAPGDPTSCTTDCGVPLLSRVVYDRPLKLSDAATVTLQVRSLVVGRIYFCPIVELRKR